MKKEITKKNLKNKEAEVNDEKILNEEDLTKPERPEDLDEQALFELIRKSYLESRKAPGDPLLSFDLIQESGTITPSPQCSQFVFQNFIFFRFLL